MEFNKVAQIVYSHMLSVEQDFAPIFKKTLNHILKQDNSKEIENKQIEELNAIYTTKFEEVDGIKLPKSLTVLLTKDGKNTTSKKIKKGQDITLYLNLLGAAEFIHKNICVSEKPWFTMPRSYSKIRRHAIYLGQIDTVGNKKSTTIDFNNEMLQIENKIEHKNTIIIKKIDLTQKEPFKRYKKIEQTKKLVWADLLTERSNYNKKAPSKQAEADYEAIA